jgi:hypothetical protein
MNKNILIIFLNNKTILREIALFKIIGELGAVVCTCSPSYLRGRRREGDGLSPGVQVQSGQHSKTLSLIKYEFYIP